MAAPVIEYRGAHDFRCTPAQLWDAIEEFEQFEGWWPWLRDFRLEGGELRDGSVLYGVVVPPLPYRMRVQVRLTNCRRPQSIEAVVGGDLSGPARLELRPVPTGTRVSATWSLEMMQAPMRLASRFAHPLLEWGHERVVEVTVARFRRHLAAAPRDGEES
jgi:carbon monoxide dehydrogenase subunit G